MTNLLPTNIVLARQTAASAVSIYRYLGSGSTKSQLVTDADRRALPQSGQLPSTDAVLSSFPRLLADPAAARVLLSLWQQECPAELIIKSPRNLTIADVSQPKVVDIFRHVVLRVYRAYSSPDAQWDKLLGPFETNDEVQTREDNIRDMVGLPRRIDHPLVVAAAAAGMAPPAAAAPTHKPFNARELMAQTMNVLM